MAEAERHGPCEGEAFALLARLEALPLLRSFMVTFPLLSRLLPALVFPVLFTTAVNAQCANVWRAGYGCPGVDGAVNAQVLWDPDGAGPLPAVVVVGGAFRIAGTVACDGLATWQPATSVWTALPAPPLPTTAAAVTALAVLPSGELVAAYGSGQGTAARVASWNGLAWTVLGADFVDQVAVLLVRSNGDLVAGGAFASLAGGAGAYLARWTGTAWQALGGGTDGRVAALAEDANGDLLATGSFTVAGTTTVNAFGRWDGLAWSGFGNNPVLGTAVAATGGSIFLGTVGGLYAWNGTSLSSVPGLSSGPFAHAAIHSLTVVRNGQLVVGGRFDAAGAATTNQIAQLDPVSLGWSAFGLGLGPAFTATAVAVTELAGGQLVVGGSLQAAGGREVANLARWTGTQWAPLAEGAAFDLACGVTLDATSFVVGGAFLECGSVAATNVARWTGTAWAPLGAGIGGRVYDLVRLPNGDLVAGGLFLNSGATVVRAVARWNGTAWSPLGGGLTGSGSPAMVSEMLVRANGDLVVAGSFTAAGGQPAANVAVWNGTSWSSLGAGVPNQVVCLTEAPNGDLLVADQAGATMGVRRWNGSSWSLVHTLASGEAIADLAVLADGTLAIAGSKSLFAGSNYQGFFERVFSGGVSRVTIPDLRTRVTGLRVLPDGDLLISGFFANFGTLSCQGLVRLRGSVFTAGLAGSGMVDSDTFPNGDLLMVGVVGTGSAAHRVGRLSTTCPATAVVAGAGCAGSGGVNVLAATALPWLGATYRAQASGLPPLGFAFRVLGFAPAAVPLPTILPQGVAGCSLLATPDVVEAYGLTGPTLATQLAIPNLPALVSQTLREQVVPLELAANGAILALTSTNALVLTIGSF